MVEGASLANAGAARSSGESAIPPLSRWEAAAYFLMGALLDIIIGLPTLGAVLHGVLINPDSYMRLVRLRDILAEHKLVHVVARDASGHGTVLAWSHLLDGVIVALAAPLSPFMGEQQAIKWVAIGFGPLSVGLLALALAWAVAPVAERRWRWAAPLLAATSLFVFGYGLPGVVHHHVPIAFTIVMSAGWAIRADQGAKAGRHMGLWSAVGMWLTPETMPFTLLAFGGAGVAWLTRADQRAYGEALHSGGNAFLLLIAAALAIDPPYGGYGEAEIDRLSVVYLVLAVVLCAIGWAIWQLGRMPLTSAKRRALGATLALAALGCWLALFPGVIKGPYALMDAERARAFFGVLSEMQPIATLRDAGADLLQGALAVMVAAFIAMRTRSLLWAYVAAAASLAVVLGALHLRFATYPTIFAAAILPVALTYCPRLLRQHSAKAASVGCAALLAAFLLGPLAGNALGGLSRPGTAQAGAITAPIGTCETAKAVDMLAPYAGQIVMADISDTPELLYRTDILTVGSAYLPDIGPYMRLRAAWRSTPSDELPAAGRATGAALLLFCPVAGRSRLVADLPPDTLWDRLDRNDVPDWLVKIAEDPRSGYALYRIAR